MKRYMMLCLMLFMCIGSFAQNRYNSRLYYRQFNNEYIKIQRKDIRYREAKIRNEDREKVQNYRSSVVEQIMDSKEEVRGIPPYHEDSTLQVGYLEGLDTLLVAFTDLMDSALVLERYKLESYEDMASYFQMQEQVEKKLDKGYALLEETEEKFADKQKMGLKRDEEIAERYELLAEVNSHLRDVDLSFYRVDHALQAFVDTINTNTTVNLDTFMLPESVNEIIFFAEEERDRTKDFLYPGLDNDLHKGLESYLEKIHKDCEKTLAPIAFNLEAEPFHTTANRNNRIDLDFFMQRYQSYQKEFLDERNKYVQNYFSD